MGAIALCVEVQEKEKIMNWLLENWETILTAVTMIVTGASVIAKLTPTETDNIFLGKLLKFIDTLAINNKPTEMK